MERPTFRLTLTDKPELKPWIHHAKAIERLKAYEDTGLEPEEIKTALDEAAREFMDYDELGPITHLRELVQAEKEGRLVVLPCKSGTKFYKISFRNSGNHVIQERYFSLTYDRPEDFGKTAFLTREEAEAALEAQKGSEADA